MAGNLAPTNLLDLANYVQQQGDIGRQQGMQNRFASLAGQAYGAQGNERNALVGQAVGVNPQAGMQLGTQLQARDDSDAKKAAGAARLVLDAYKSGNAAQLQGAYRSVVPFLTRLGAAQGKVPPPEFSEDMLPGLYQTIAAAGGDNMSGMPTGFREFELTARAAGLQPGTPEYEQAARVGLGVSPRAVTGAVKSGTIKGADGLDRPFIFDPATQSYKVFDGQQWREMGQQEAAQASGQAGAPGRAPAIIPAANGQPAMQADGMEGYIAQANNALQMGADEGKVRQWLMQKAQETGGQPQSRGYGDLAVSRSPEDTAAAVEAAKQRVGLEYLPQTEAIKTQAEAERARNKSSIDQEATKAKAQPKARLALEQATQRIGRVDDLVNSILPRIGTWTAGFLGSKAASIPGTPAYDLAADLKTLQAIAGFDQLNAMRQASPTGGALGNVTEREMEYLQSVVRNIQNSQSPEQLRRNLLEYQKAVKSSWKAVNDAYQQDFGGSQSQVAAPVDDLLSKYGVQ